MSMRTSSKSNSWRNGREKRRKRNKPPGRWQARKNMSHPLSIKGRGIFLFTLSAGQSVGQSIGKSTATSTITSTITSKRTKKDNTQNRLSGGSALAFTSHVQSAQKCDTIFDVSSPSQSYSFFQYLLRQKTKTNPEAFQRLSDHIKIRVSSIYKAYRLFQKYFRKNKLND